MKNIISIIITLTLFSCTSTEKDSTIHQTKTNKTSVSEEDYIVLENLFIEGDFDGDGNTDKIIQIVTDANGNTISKIPAHEEWEKTVEYILKNNINTKLYLENKRTDTLEIGNSIGLYCLINISDNNKDQKDEIIFVTDLPDYSNLNTARIYTFCNNKWTQLKTFTINESISFNWEGEVKPTFKDIPGFLSMHNNNWVYTEYNDDYIYNPEKMEKLIVPKCR